MRKPILREFMVKYITKPISEAPMNGTPILVTHTMRYLPYKKDGQRQMGKKGRWQEATEYGWKNAEVEPEEFLELDESL